MRKIKQISLVLTAVVVMMATFLFTAGNVEAAQKAPKFEKAQIDCFLEKKDLKNYFYSVNILNLKDNAVVTKVKSGNKEIFDTEYRKGNKYIKIIPKKTGKAVVSCTIKQNGKTYKLKKKITVYKGNPFKSILVNDKPVYKKGYNTARFYTPAKKVKVSFELKDGWKIKRVYYNYHNYKGKKMTKNYKIKNGDTIKIGKGSHTSVKIDVVNSKGRVYRYLVMLYYNAKGAEYFFAPAVNETVFFDGTK